MTIESEAGVERSIREAGLNAPRLTPADVDAAIVGETFTRLPSGKKLVCEIVLRNGFTVTGEASVISLANFDPAIGAEVSRRNARERVWPPLGFLLQDKLAKA